PDLYADHDATLPLLHWQLFSRYFIFDPQRGIWNLIYLDRPDTQIKTVDKVWSEMRNILNLDLNATPEINSAATDLEIIQTPDKAHFHRILRKCLDYIAAGDIYQANLSAEWLVRTTINPYQIYQNMIALSPAAYCAFVRFGEHSVCSISPELFIARRGDELLTQPIKGTRSRHLDDPIADNRNRDDLLQSPKDRSELAMIVDLLRNDLGKVCIPGSVRVIDRRRMEAHPTVWHTSAQITGTLKSGPTSRWAALVAGVCPGGSISGVPKIRAMEIIAELERRPRGIYCGNIGWIHPNGDGVLNIAIRTLHIFRSMVRISAGSGIVAESDPEEEFAEIHAKAFALLKALHVDIQAPVTR
ncbi:MAG TPA: anthranilate synthase component I family protein, partial [Phycisphaerae bacterium]|nr:anthranilate synthase component I family protein [Phycisphaerae bacterium]